MGTFKIGDVVTLDSNSKMYNSYESSYIQDVLKAFEGRTPIGFVCCTSEDFPVGYDNMIGVDWRVSYYKFHTCSHKLGKSTGYFHTPSYLKLLNTTYNPDQEPEDDCL